MNGVPPPVRAYLASIDALLTMTMENLRNMTDAMKKKLEEEYGGGGGVPAPPPPPAVQREEQPPPTVVDEEEPSFEPLFASPPRSPSPPPYYQRRLREPSLLSSSSSSSDEEEEEEDDSEFGASSSSSSSSNEEEVDEEEEKPEEKKKRARNPNAFVVSDDEEIEKYSKETERRHEEKRRLGILRKKAPKLEIEEEGDYEMEEDDSEQDNIDLFEEEGSHAEDGVPVEDGRELASIMGWAKNYAPSGPWWDSQFGNAHNMVRENLGLQGNNEEAQSYFDAIIKGCANKTASKLPHTKKIRELLKQEKCCFCNNKKPCRQVLVVPGLKEPGYIAACCAQLANAVIAFYKTFYECARNKKSAVETFKKLRRLHGEILEAHAGKANFHDKKKKKN